VDCWWGKECVCVCVCVYVCVCVCVELLCGWTSHSLTYLRAVRAAIFICLLVSCQLKFLYFSLFFRCLSKSALHSSHSYKNVCPYMVGLKKVCLFAIGGLLLPNKNTHTSTLTHTHTHTSTHAHSLIYKLTHKQTHKSIHTHSLSFLISLHSLYLSWVSLLIRQQYNNNGFIWCCLDQ